MKVTNDEKTVLNSVEKLNVTGDECRICLKRCNEVWQLFHQTDEEISRKLMAIAAIQVRFCWLHLRTLLVCLCFVKSQQFFFFY